MDSRFTNLGDNTNENRMARIMMGNAPSDNVAAKHCDHIYATGEGQLNYVQQCDTLASVRFSVNFQSLTLPGSATLNLPNASIIDTIMIRAQLASWPTDCSLPRGWLALLVDRVEWRIGGGQPYVYSGQQMLQEALEACETINKRDQFLRLAGDSRIAADASAQEANYYLSLPISRIAYDNHQLPFDTRMLSTQSQFTVYFKSLAEICGGSGVASLPTSFSLGQFIIRDLNFKNPLHSISDDLRLNPMLSYSHPVIWSIHSQLQVTTSNTATLPTQVTLTGFRAGNLNSITFFIVPDAQINPGGNNARNVMNTLRMENIRLEFNGVPLQICNGRSHDLINMANNFDPNFFFNNLITGTSSATFNQAPINSYYYTFDLSQYNAIRKFGSVQSGLEIQSNQLNFSFTTPDSNAASARLYISYRYASAIKISDRGGVVDQAF